MKHAKNYEITKIICNTSIQTKRVAPFFPGNVIYDFWAQKFYKVV